MSTNETALPQRPYGNTGITLSIIGLGGMVLAGTEQADSNRIVARAIERGVNYFDVAPTYGDAEERMGPALEPYRANVFLACKTLARTRDEGREEFERSLQRLRTDHVDLYQLHALMDVERDVDGVFAEGGVMELVEEAKRDGRIRHVGFSAHTVEAAKAALDRYAFDSVLFPVNFASFFAEDFGPQILAKAAERGAARLALKAMAKQLWADEREGRPHHPKCWYEPISDYDTASMALRWTLNQNVTAAIPPGEEDLFWMAVDIASGPLAIEAGEVERLRDLAGQVNAVFGA